MTALMGQPSRGAALRETADWPLELPVSSVRPNTPVGPHCRWCYGEAERRMAGLGVGAIHAEYFRVIGESPAPWCRAVEGGVL